MAPDRTVPPDLASRVNAARMRAGFSVADLARACSLSKSHLHAVLTGQRTLTPAVARRLLAALHMHESTATEVLDNATGRYVSSAGFGVIETT